VLLDKNGLSLFLHATSAFFLAKNAFLFFVPSPLGFPG